MAANSSENFARPRPHDRLGVIAPLADKIPSGVKHLVGAPFQVIANHTIVNPHEISPSTRTETPPAIQLLDGSFEQADSAAEIPIVTFIPDAKASVPSTENTSQTAAQATTANDIRKAIGTNNPNVRLPGYLSRINQPEPTGLIFIHPVGARLAPERHRSDDDERLKTELPARGIFSRFS